MVACVIIPVMRRTSLLPTVQHYIRLGRDVCRRIYIADFDPHFTHHLLGDLTAHPCIEHVGIVGQAFFNKAVAINIASLYTLEDQLIICDADVRLPHDLFVEWLDTLQTTNNLLIHLAAVRETVDGSTRPGFGIVAITRKNFFQLEGYCSEFRGWGFEDRDFLSRAELAGLDVRPIGIAPHQSHSEMSRTENYEEKNRDISRERNLRLFEQRKRRIRLYGTLASDARRSSCHQ